MSAEHKTERVGTHSRLGVSPGGEVSSGFGARSGNFNPGGHCPIRHIVFRRIRRAKGREAKALKAADNPRACPPAVRASAGGATIAAEVPFR